LHSSLGAPNDDSVQIFALPRLSQVAATGEFPVSSSNLADFYNRDLIESEYLKWSQNPASVDLNWHTFFAGAEFAGNGINNRLSEQRTIPGDLRLQTGVVRVMNWYRQAGHFQAHIDPLQKDAPPPNQHLKLENFGLGEADLDKTVDGSMYFGINGPVILRDLLQALKDTYCRHLGAEFMHIDDLEKRMWLARRMETTRNNPTIPLTQKYRTLMTLHWAAYFEQYLHRKYVGQKRFSLEGGETLLPMLDAMVELSPSLGIKEIVIGMAHRGRLNVLANILNKPFSSVFNEFQDNYMPESSKDGDGDVKYHMGFQADVKTSSGDYVHLSVTPNPSHLEIVNPVVEGRVRCKQRQHGDTDRSAGVPLLIHGDAAFAGQGVVAETLNLMNLSGYRTGGTVHIIINNQIGFTTSPRDARSTQYCSDIAKFIQVPVFHVHGEKPEAAVYAIQLALEYRQKFKSDVVIDLVCYRKYGHNEGDEPSITQPLEYEIIRSKKPVPEMYQDDLIREASIKTDEAEAIIEDFKNRLDYHLKVAQEKPLPKKMSGFAGGGWEGLTKTYTHKPAVTKISEETLDKVADQLGTLPEGFVCHSAIDKLIKSRQESIRGRKHIDWGTAEAVAFGSLLLEGKTVRLSGQDCRRGTFSHRHSWYVDQKTGQSYCPLAAFSTPLTPFEVYDSSLSEAAILGFEYGYSLEDPHALVLWEGQFGDFVNGAQVIIDQFITSAESKWNRASGLVLLLPHGMEGQGPEHSSARLERFLQGCAEDNVQVCNFSTPANYFHALRRQLARDFRKPLIVMTPKSLLRIDGKYPVEMQPASLCSELTEGQFREVIDDPFINASGVKRVVLCSGKVYYDLVLNRKMIERTDVALVRLEQFYPWPQEQLQAVLSRYKGAKEYVWLQEESQNNGGWFFVEPLLREMGYDFKIIARDASASPSSGSSFVHKHEQSDLVDAAFNKPAPYLVKAEKKK
jgi:2-oxoglutarate dehydrogenase E1 component